MVKSNNVSKSIIKRLNELQNKIKILENENKQLQKFIRTENFMNTTIKSPTYFTILHKKEVGKINFNASPLDLLLGIIYILKKYKNVCVPLKLKKSDRNLTDFSVIWTCSSFRKIRKLYFPRSFKSNWKRCKKRFIIIPLILLNVYPCGSKKKDFIAHANYLIYDSKKKELERFEPYGTQSLYNDFYESDKIDSKVRQWFKKNLGINNYFSPVKTCPGGGFQDLQSIERLERIGDPAGFCMIWSLWYVNLRLKYPNMKKETLVKKAISKLDASVHSRTVFIRNYANYIQNKKYKMLQHFSRESIENEHPAVIKEINQELSKLI